MKKSKFLDYTMMAILVLRDSLQHQRKLADKYGYKPTLKSCLTKSYNILDECVTELNRKGGVKSISAKDIPSFKNKLEENITLNSNLLYKKIERTTDLPDDFMNNITSLMAIGMFFDKRCLPTAERYFKGEYYKYRKQMEYFEKFLEEEIFV